MSEEYNVDNIHEKGRITFPWKLKIKYQLAGIDFTFLCYITSMHL
jgi:hypothetical protein